MRSRHLMTGTLRMLAPRILVAVLLTHLVPVTSRPTDRPEVVPTKPLNADYQTLQTLLGQNLAGSPQENAKVVDMVLQLLSEIDLPTICGVIARDTNGSFKDLLQVQNKPILQTQDSAFPEMSSRENVELSEITAPLPLAQTDEDDDIAQIRPQDSLLSSTNAQQSNPLMIPDINNSQDTEDVKDLPANDKSLPKSSTYNNIDPTDVQPMTNKSDGTGYIREKIDDSNSAELLAVPRDTSNSASAVSEKMDKLKDNVEPKLDSNSESVYPYFIKNKDSPLSSKLDPAQSVRELKEMHLRFMYRPGDYADSSEDGNRVDLAQESFKTKSGKPLAQLYSKPLLLGDWLNDKNTLYGDAEDYKESNTFGEHTLQNNAVESDNADNLLTAIDEKKLLSDSLEKLLVGTNSDSGNHENTMDSWKDWEREKNGVGNGLKDWEDEKNGVGNRLNDWGVEKIGFENGLKDWGEKKNDAGNVLKNWADEKNGVGNGLKNWADDKNGAGNGLKNWGEKKNDAGNGWNSRRYNVNQQQNDLEETNLTNEMHEAQGVSKLMIDSLADQSSSDVAPENKGESGGKEVPVLGSEVDMKVRKMLDVAKDKIVDIAWSSAGVAKERDTNTRETGFEEAGYQNEMPKEGETPFPPKIHSQIVDNLKEPATLGLVQQAPPTDVKRSENTAHETSHSAMALKAQGFVDGERLAPTDYDVTQYGGKAIPVNSSTAQYGDQVVSTDGRAIQYGDQVVSTDAKAAQYGDQVVSTNAKAAQYGDQVVSTDAKAAQYGDQVVSTDGRAIQYGDQVVATNAKAEQYGDQVVSTDGRAIQYGDQVVSTDAKAALYGDQVVSTDAKAAQYGDQVVSTDAKAAQYGDQVVSTDGRAAQYGDQVVSTVSTTHFHKQSDESNDTFTRDDGKVVKNSDSPTSQYNEHYVNTDVSATSHEEEDVRTDVISNANTSTYGQQRMTVYSNTSQQEIIWTDNLLSPSPTALHTSTNSYPEETHPENEKDLFGSINFARQDEMETIMTHKNESDADETTVFGYEEKQMETTFTPLVIRSETYSNRINAFSGSERTDESSETQP